MSSPAPDNSPGATRTVQPHTDDAGGRLDKVLATHLTPVTRTRVKALIEAGHVTGAIANAEATIRDASYRVKPER